jgi:hypothetical protein
VQTAHAPDVRVVPSELQTSGVVNAARARMHR